MAEFDATRNRLTIKLVYYGPAQSGKTTNLACLHSVLRPELKGEMMTLETKGDRTLFFDLLPIGLKAKTGLFVKIKLFTVPGQVAHDSTRKAVLSRADGVVFVADSQLNQETNNQASFENLTANVARVGLNLENLPLVVQFNKQDLEHISAREDIEQKWQGTPWPVMFSSALKGEGVVETLRALLGVLYQRLNERYSLAHAHFLDQSQFVDQLLGQAVES